MSFKTDPYIATLSPEILNMAKDEFGEDEHLRQNSLIAIRDWIKMQPHLISSITTDAIYLIKFLRISKFSLDETKHKLELYATLRNALPEFFSRWDPMESVNQTILNYGCFLPLMGYDHLGRRVLLVRPGAFNPNKIKLEQFIKALTMVYKIFWDEDEQISITGQIIIFDFKGFGFDHLAQISLSMTNKLKALKDSTPILLKCYHFFNTTSFNGLNVLIDALFNKEKIIKRICMHGDNLESLKKEVPMDILPKDYGGNGMSVKKLTKYWKKKTEENRHFLMKYENMDRSDESQRVLGQPKTSAELFGIEGSFRKLNVD